MEKGRHFLRAQINNASAQHQMLVDNLEDHIRQADDSRYRSLCERYLAKMIEHQRTLEEYGASIGAEGRTGVKKTLGAVLGKARDAVDSMRETDFLRLVGDIVAIRQSQDTFATFAAAGEKIGEPRLSEIGRAGERDHDEMQREFNTLIQSIFVAHVLESGKDASAETRPEAR